MNLEIRDVTIEDALTLARLQVDVWRETYSEYMPKQVLDSLDYEYRLKSWNRTILERGTHNFIRLVLVEDEPAGFVLAEVKRKGDFDSELVALNILKKFKGQGLGKTLMHMALNFCRRRGARNLFLMVASRNENAKDFYHRMGGKYEETAATHHGYGVTQSRLFWEL